MKTIAKFFFEGLLVIVPVVLSLYIVYVIFTKIDGLLGIPIPGVGLVITLVFITFVGILAKTFLTGWAVRLFERLFAKLPLIKVLYGSIKDLMSAFVGDKKSFNKPVVVTLDAGAEVKVIGFVTKTDLGFLGLPGQVSVYLPQSYNFAGTLMIFPKDKVQPITANSAEVMTFLLSGGVSGPDEQKK
ncbi:MAG: DUF502 domain-containing protein [Deltaproteobacteria bacterium]|nr:DUF502 domain-containing protein [Deltaproteobacteria bacterium]